MPDRDGAGASGRSAHRIQPGSEAEALIERIVAGAGIPSAEAREELRRELRTHFDEDGASPQAMRDAVRRFGDAALLARSFRRVYRRDAARTRAAGAAAWLGARLAAALLIDPRSRSAMLHDLRFGFRMLRRSPGFSILAVLCLTLGIGANAAVFSWIEGILLRPFPLVADQQRLVAVAGTDRGAPGTTDMSWPDFIDLQRNSTLVEAFIAEKITGTTLSLGDRAERVPGSMVSANYFSAMGVRPILGRGFEPDEDSGRGAHPVAVISYKMWRERFRGDPGVIGKTQVLAGLPHTIVGVAPEGFYGTFVGYAFQFWVPASMQPQFDAGVYKLEDRSARWIEGFARLKPGVTIAQAQAEVTAIAARLEADYPETNRGFGVRLFPLWRTPFNNAASMLPTLAVAVVVVLAVLFIACANVGNLLLVRAFARQQEIAVRLSIGANRARLVRQLLTEGLILSTIATAGGLMLAGWLRDALAFLTPPRGGVALRLAGALDWRVLASSAAVCVVSTLLFGLVPAVLASNVNLADALRSESGGIVGARGRKWMRSTLVLVQMSLSFVLLVGAGLLLQSLQAIRHANPGFATEGVLTTSVDLFTAGYDVQRAAIFQDELVDRLQALGGIESAAWSRLTPFTFRSYSSAPIAVDGYDVPPDRQPTAEFNEIGPGYFATMGIALVSGREFTRDDTPQSRPVAIVDQAMASQYWRGKDPLGTRLRVNGRWLDVVGVARTAKYRDLLEPPTPFFYVPLRQRPSPTAALQIRTAQPPSALAPVVAREIHALDPNVSPGELITMREQVDRTTASQRIAVAILGVFGGLALFLAAIGLYGVMASTVAHRAREIALRMALGASGADVLRLIMSTGVALTAGGAAVGAIIAFQTTRLLGYLLYDVSPRDPSAFAAAMVVITVASLSACIVPAWRATRSDPVRALRA